MEHWRIYLCLDHLPVFCYLCLAFLKINSWSQMELICEHELHASTSKFYERILFAMVQPLQRIA